MLWEEWHGYSADASMVADGQKHAEPYSSVIQLASTVRKEAETETDPGTVLQQL